MDPDGLGATTIAAHHGVGSVTWEITPRLSIRFNSCLTFSHRGIGMFLAIKSEKGLASGFRLMVYSLLKVHNPLKSAGYWTGAFSSMALMPVIILRSLMAGSPNKLCCNSRTINTH